MIISGSKQYVAEHWKHWDTFVAPLMHAYNVQIHPTTRVPPFSLEIVWLPHGPIVIVCTMIPQVKKIGSSFTYQLKLIRRATFPRKIAEKNSKKVQARYRNDYDKQIWSEPCSVAGDHLFIERTATNGNYCGPHGLGKIFEAPALLHGATWNYPHETGVRQAQLERYAKQRIHLFTNRGG